MKNIIIYVSLLIFNFSVLQATAQNDTIGTQKKERVEQLKQKIIEDEKEKLKIDIETINYRLEHQLITKEEAEKRKKEAAEKHALNIGNRISILQNQVELKEREGVGASYIALFGKGKVLDININSKDEKVIYDRRTTTDLVLAAGFNNALASGQSLNDSDFKLAGSRFFEIGWAWKTRVFEKSNWLRVKYGVSFQFNGLKPTDNRYFVENGDLTQLEKYPSNLNKSKFRTDNLVVPLHFEFGPSKKTETADYFRFSTENRFKIGLGGYAGFNIGERQKLKYNLDGDNKKDKLKNDYNTNDFVYGLSGYISLGGTALYVKYDMNPLFKTPNTELHNLSFGLRFDVD